MKVICLNVSFFLFKMLKRLECYVSINLNRRCKGEKRMKENMKFIEKRENLGTVHTHQGFTK